MSRPNFKLLKKIKQKTRKGNLGFINIGFGFSNDNAKLVVLSLATAVQSEWYNAKRKAGWHSAHSFCFIRRLLDASFSFLMWII